MDSHKKLSFHAVYGEYKLNKKDGFNAGLSFSYEPYDKDSVTVENTSIMGLFGGYAGNGIRAGLEFDTKKNKDAKAQIISTYVTYRLSDKISLLGRLDMYDPDTSVGKDGVQDIIVGVMYNAEKGLTIAPTFRMFTPEEGDGKNSVVINFQFVF
jgi:hypothetical protein